MSIKKILFFIERDFHIAMLKPLMQHIYSNKSGEMKIYAPFNKNINILVRNYLPFFVEATTDPWTWQPDITFVADFSYQYVEGLGKIVNIGHGTISKGWFFSKNKISQRENCADLICVPGQIHKERLESQVFKPIIVTGMPKLDNCFNNSLNREELMARFRLDPEQKTVLLAPTFNEEFSILPYLQQTDLSKIFPDYINLIVKLHGVSDESLKRIFERLKTENRKVYISDSYDIDELYFIADLLISDVSSVVYEFLSLNKPILLFDSPKQKTYINYDESDLEWEFRDVGYRFDNVEKLPSLIFKALTSAHNIGYQEIGKKFIGVRDGTSATQIVQAALHLLDRKQENELTIICNKDNPTITELGVGSEELGVKLPTPNFQLPTPNSQLRVGGAENVLKSLAEMVAKIKTKYILYLDSTLECSPQMINLLYNHIKQNDKAGIVVPLIYDNEVHLQQMRFRVNLAQEYDFYQTGIQLGYAFTGQSQEIDYILPHCFIIHRNLLMNKYFTDLNNPKLSILELLTYTAQNNYKVLLAYDCHVKRNEKINELNEKEPLEQTFLYDEALQKEIDNVSTLSEDELKQKIYENPYNENTILKLIQFYFHNQQWEQLDIYADMLANNPRAAYYGIKSLENQGFIEEAYNKLIQTDLNTLRDNDLLVNFLVLKAKLLMKLEIMDDVLNILNQAIIQHPSNTESLLTRGIYYFSQGQAVDAITDFNAVLSINPLNTKALQGIALSLQIDNKPAESSLYFLKILANDEENLEAISGLLKNAWITRDFIDAEKALDNYLSFHPANLDVLFTLAGICYETGKFAKARELLDRIMIFEPDFPGARELLEKIKR